MIAAADQLQDVLEKLEGVRSLGNDRYSARCCCHEDNRASLSISKGNNGKILFHCHAGCTYSAIAAKLGMSNGHNGKSESPRIISTYDYGDENGDLIYQAIRYQPKDFRQRRPDGNGGWIWNMQGVRYVPYRLPDLLNAFEERPDDWVFPVEGEKDTDNLWDRGLIGTCNVGGAGKWRDEYSERLRGKRCCIIAHKDKAGRDHAEKVAGSLVGKAAEIRIIELPGGAVKDASDFLSAGGTAEQIIELANNAPAWTASDDASAGESDQNRHAVSDQSSSAEPWPDPQPLPAGLPPVMAFDYSLLPDSQHGWIEDITQRMQCPPDFCATTVMIMAGALIGRKIAIRPKRHDDWQVAPNLYGANVGRPSLLKSPAMKEVLKFLAKEEIDAKAEYAKQLIQHETAALVGEATKKIKKEALKQAVKDGKDGTALAEELAKESADPPTRRRYIVNDTTVEKLGVILSENPNGVLLYLDELISLLRSMEREGHEADRGFYLTAWAGDSRYTYDRIGRGTIDIEATIVSIVGSIQPDVLNSYLREAVSGGSGNDGFMQRFQVTVWPDAPTTWRNVDRYPDSQAKSVAHAALKRLVNITPGMVEAERDNFDLDAMPFLRFERDAQGSFDAWRENLESRLRSGTDHPAIESHLAKFRSLIPSLALILHLLDGGIGPVNNTSLERAIQWGEYLESHARRLYAGVTEAPAVAARLLAARIQANDLGTSFASRDVYRNGWAGLDRERTVTAIDVLLALNWVEERIEPTPGKSRTRYVVNPKIKISPRDELTKVTEAPFGSFVSDILGDESEIGPEVTV